MMDAMAEEGINTVVIMSSAQMGKSEVLFNCIGYFADQDPTAILMLQPTLDMGSAVSKDRIAPMFRDTPALKDKIGARRSKDSDNTLLHKKFPGGHLTICGANSAASLASRPIRVVLADEIDRYPASAGAEGDPLNLAKKRTATFHNRKILMASTPTVKGASRIEMAYEESDQRRFYVPCPHCDLMQPLEWSHLQWAKGDDGHWDGTAPWYSCDGCGTSLTEADKARMLKGGRWVAEGTAAGVAGFHLNELYSPWRLWREMVVDFLEAKKDSELLRVFVNTSLGETFEEAGEGLEPEGLFARCEQYAAEVPDGAVVLTAGVDVHPDRLEAEVFGWGLDQERWSITSRVLWGDPDKDDVWEALDDIIIRGLFKHESGATLCVSSTCIDSGGHNTQRVYEYCRSRKGRRIFAIKGMGGFGRAMVSAPSRKRHGRNRRPVDLFTLGVDEIKSLIHSRLCIIKPGPGFCHFPISDEYDQEYFDQLTAEKVQTKFTKGVPVRVWVQTRPRNEAFDNNVYGYAAFILLNPNLEALADKLGEAVTPEEPAEIDAGLGNRGRLAPRRRGGFVNSWK